MAREDLRVTKTRESIRSAYLELLAERGFGRVSVTELARRARIAKGTFYLHYQDIPSLHDALVAGAIDSEYGRLSSCSLLLSDPARWLLEIREVILSAPAEERLLLRYVDGVRHREHVVALLEERIFDEGGIERSGSNELRLFALLNAVSSLLPRVQDELEPVAQIIKVIAAALFPDLQA